MLQAEPLGSLRRAALAAGIGLAGVLLWPALAGVSEATLRAAAEVTIGELTFGRGGRVAFELASTRKGAGSAFGHESWSTVVELRIDGVDDRNRVRINARRFLYLPCITLAALVLASPLSTQRKAIALAAGAGVLVVAALVSIWLMVVWLFAFVPGLVYDLSAFQRLMLDFGYEGWVTALGNRYIAPLAVAAVLILVLSGAPKQLGPTSQADPRPSPPVRSS